METTREEQVVTKKDDMGFTFTTRCPNEKVGKELLKDIKQLALDYDLTNYQVVRKSVDLLKKDLKKQ